METPGPAGELCLDGLLPQDLLDGHLRPPERSRNLVGVEADLALLDTCVRALSRRVDLGLEVALEDDPSALGQLGHVLGLLAEDLAVPEDGRLVLAGVDGDRE